VRRFVLFASLTAIFCGIFIGTAGAVQIAVSTPADEFNANPARCSLREAIQAANTDSNAQSPGCVAGSGNDSIALSTGNYTTTINGSDNTNQAGDLDIGGSGSLSISAAPGADVVISNSAGAESVLDVQAGGDLSLDGVEVSGGSGNFGGAVRNNGSARLSHVLLRGNGNGSGFGGGAFNSGTLSITDSTIAANTTTFGAGLFQGNTGNLSVTHSTLRNNHATFGGALFLQGPAQFDRVAVVDNGADYGGGLFIQSAAVAFTNSTVAGNTGRLYVGAAYIQGSTAQLDLSSSTVSANAQTDSTSAPPNSGGIFQMDPSLVRLRDSILAGNSQAGPAPAPDCNGGTVVSLGHSLLGSNQNCAYSAGAGDIVNADPKLAPLADNGGATLTMLPLAGSPAIDAGASALTVDQRAAPRPADVLGVPNAANGSDIGAAELAPVNSCQGKAATIVGSDGADTLKGTGKADVIVAGAGDDKINAGKGNDIVCGGAGNETIKGGAGKDTLLGEDGKDKLFGQAGKDTLKGGPGADKLVGGPAKDKLQGGPGKDKQVQ